MSDSSERILILIESPNTKRYCIVANGCWSYLKRIPSFIKTVENFKLHNAPNTGLYISHEVHLYNNNVAKLITFYDATGY